MIVHIGRRWKAMSVALFSAIILAGLAGAWRLPMLAQIDLGISRTLQRIRNPYLDSFMEIATWLGAGLALPIVAFVVAAALFRVGRRREALAAALSVLSLLLNMLLKAVANRPRPEEPVEVMTKVFGSSFPSGHSMGSAAVYGTIAALLWTLSGKKKTVLWLLLLPFFVGLSRIYLGAHWGYDVMAGWAAGALCVVGVMDWLRGTASPKPKPEEIASAAADPEVSISEKTLESGEPVPPQT
ncbi:phosphatase PAP2 family protein [bacterium]|nr:MAG: phosphatase PAP2 family protein [bacterium]